MRHTLAVTISVVIVTCAWISLLAWVFLDRQPDKPHANTLMALAAMGVIWFAASWKVTRTRYGFDDTTLWVRNWFRAVSIPFATVDTVQFCTFISPKFILRTGAGTHKISCYVNSLPAFAAIILAKAPHAVRDDRGREVLEATKEGRLPEMFGPITIPDQSD